MLTFFMRVSSAMTISSATDFFVLNSQDQLASVIQNYRPPYVTITIEKHEKSTRHSKYYQVHYLQSTPPHYADLLR